MALLTWGSGFVWIRPEIQEPFDPPMVSWLGIQDYLGLARAIEVLMEIGVEDIRRHVYALHAPVLEWIESRAT